MKKSGIVSPGKEVFFEELRNELKHLRGEVREVGENFILRREGEIETIISCLDGIPATKLKREAPQWLREMRSLKMKPAKGRLKDLRAVDEFLKEMTENVIDAQEGGKNKERG